MDIKNEIDDLSEKCKIPFIDNYTAVICKEEKTFNSKFEDESVCMEEPVKVKLEPLENNAENSKDINIPNYFTVVDVNNILTGMYFTGLK